MDMEVDAKTFQGLLAPQNRIKIDFTIFTQLLTEVKVIKESEDSSNQIGNNSRLIRILVNAFVALGGNHDKTGRVLKSDLANVLRNQFELSFQIQELLDKNCYDSNQLNYETFSQMFQQVMETNREEIVSDKQNDRKSRTATVAPLALRVRDKEASVKIGEEGSTTRIYYSDFQAWLQVHK